MMTRSGAIHYLNIKANDNNLKKTRFNATSSCDIRDSQPPRAQSSDDVISCGACLLSPQECLALWHHMHIAPMDGATVHPYARATDLFPPSSTGPPEKHPASL